MGLMKRFLSPKGAQAGSGAGTGGITAELLNGDKLFDQLGTLRKTAARRVMTAGAAVAAAELRRRAKASVPSRYKTARKAIWSRRLKAREAPDGGAKVGGRVGKGSNKYARGEQAGRKGVGIGAQNIHWAFTGTGTFSGNSERRTGKKGGVVRVTGSMPPFTAPMWVLAVRNKSLLKSMWRNAAWKQMKKEVAAGKAFKK